MTPTHPEGSTPERHALETARIAEVFGLTGGELADEVWTETAVHETSSTLYEVKSHWWYEGVPEWTEQDYVDSDYEYRTMVRDCLFGNPPARLSGQWEFVAAYRSSGETECHHKDAGIADADCQLCEGDGFIYIGDGWAEVVYRREVAEDEDNAPRVSLSSGHFSTDQQLEDAVSWLETAHPDTYASFVAAFPEWPRRTMGEGISSWFDTDAMGVDAEWSSWCIDWLENNAPIWWEDGEPWGREDIDA